MEADSNNPRVERVFVVHGHDHQLRNKVASFVTNLGKEPIILSECASGGRTIIEKFEHYAGNVDYAIVLMTADDSATAQSDGDTSQPRLRVRQNVLFELGYLVAKLGRGKVCLLCDSGIEIPTDLSGVVYVSLQQEQDWPWRVV